MSIQERKKGFLLMQSFWILAIIASCVSFLAVGDTMPFIALFTAGIIHLIGSFVYLGYTDILAGFNTMSPDEIEKYDMERISAFFGISFVLTSFISFFGSFIVLILAGDREAVGFLITILLVSIFFCSIYVSTDKFKKQPGMNRL